MRHKVTRGQLHRLSKATKSERRISEILKRHRIRFLYKQRVGRYEVDFLIGRVALEIDGKVHREIDIRRESFFFSQGLVPLHLSAYADMEAVERELIMLIKSNNAV